MKKKKETITGRGKPMSVPEHLISFAPWNPRPDITEEDVAELAASVREKGLLNRLSVMALKPDGADGEPHFVVFAGNRRLAACRLAGLKEIPCELFDVTEEEAKVLTALENLQRKDVEPIREAALVEECLAGGMTGEEIAAKVGKSNAWVTRRRKLLSLDRKFIEAAEAHPDKISTDALENIAIYPPAVQKKLAGSVLSRISYSTIRWSDICTSFERELRDLDTADFICVPKCGSREVCERCAKRTGAQGDLFGAVPDGELGRCLDVRCFDETKEAWKRAMIEEAVPQGVEVVEVKYAWEFPKEATGKKKTRANPCAYVLFEEGYGHGPRVDVRFGPSADALRELRQREAAERAEIAKADNERRQRKSEVADKILSVDADKLMSCEAFLNMLADGIEKDVAKFVAEAIVFYLDDRGYEYETLYRAASGIAAIHELSGVTCEELALIKPQDEEEEDGGDDE